MITGTLMYDITVEVKDEAALDVLKTKLSEVAKGVEGIKELEEVDSDLDEEDDEEEKEGD